MRLIPMAIACVLLSSAAAPVLAGAPTDRLRASIDQMIKTLADPALRADEDRRHAEIRQVASNVFDFREAAQRALGRHWRQLSDTDREEFTSLFADLLERAYIGRIEQYSGERIAFLGESVDQGSDLATVKTRFTTKNGTDIPVDYRMIHRGDRWLVYDVSVEGLSLIANYRSQFNHIIETSSYQDLVKRMRDKAEEFMGPGAAQPRRTSLTVVMERA